MDVEATVRLWILVKTNKKFCTTFANAFVSVNPRWFIRNLYLGSVFFSFSFLKPFSSLSNLTNIPLFVTQRPFHIVSAVKTTPSPFATWTMI